MSNKKIRTREQILEEVIYSQSQTSDFDISDVHNGTIIEVDCTSGNITITVPPSVRRGFSCVIDRVDGSANEIDIAAGSGASILSPAGLKLLNEGDQAVLRKRESLTNFRLSGNLSA